MSDQWEEFRRLMPISGHWAYFDHAAVAPISLPAHDAVVRWSREALDEGDTVWSQWSERAEQTRHLAASLIGAHSDEIALVPNTTTGINIVANGFPWKDGDNVVVPANEFPTNLYPWLNLQSRGVQTRRVEVPEGRMDLDRVAQACDRRTRIIAISWVGFATGWRIDIDRLAEMARRLRVLVCLDAIQGLGVFPIDVGRTPIDFLAADGHKWLLGPEGAGIFYMRREHLDLLRVTDVGWNSVVHRHDHSHIQLDLRREAARYEGGSQNMVGFHALGASLRLLMRFGASPSDSALAQRVLDITDNCCQRLTEVGATVTSHREGPHRSGIVAFEMPGADPNVVRKRCLRAHVAISCRNGRLRLSPHAYNNQDDVQRLICALSTPA